MTKNIGRNDPCPCGSGIKYKKCCLIKRNQPKVIERVEFRNKSEEDYVIGELLRSSEEFNAFYKGERSKIVGTLVWVKDLSLPEGVDFRCTRLPTGEKVIRLRRVPAKIGEAMSIAHELQHLVIDNDGFPNTGAGDQYENLSSALNSMVHDPIVNKRLQAYGFDLRADYEEKTREDLRQLRIRPNTPFDRFTRMRWLFNYVKDILLWELICAEGDNGKSEFQAWFDSRYPEIANRGQKVLSLVRSIGYDTPEKMRTLFKEIIRRYRLSDIISEVG